MQPTPLVQSPSAAIVSHAPFSHSHIKSNRPFYLSLSSLIIPFPMHKPFPSTIFPLLLLYAMTFFSCVSEDEYADTAEGNLEALWSNMHQRYCFFEE